MTSLVTSVQQRAAWWAGFLFLATNITAAIAFYLRGQLVVRGDPVQTSAKIVASDLVFRAGILIELATVVGVIALAVALYTALKPINSGLALVALLWRIAENFTLAVKTLNSFSALTLLSGAAYLGALDEGARQSLAYVALRTDGVGFQVGFLFLGCGSTLFAWLWWRSRYIPRVLSALGLGASLAMVVGTSSILLVPSLSKQLGLSYMLPLGLFEISVGLWLMIKGLRSPEGAADDD